MRSSLFGLRPAAAGSTVGSPIQPGPIRPDMDIVEPLSLPPSAAAPSPPSTPRSRPLTRLAEGLTTLRKAAQSPAPIPPSVSPVVGPTTTASVTYLDSLSLKLGEAVNKALIAPPQLSKPVAGAVDLEPVLKGKRPIPAGRGRALGALIAR